MSLRTSPPTDRSGNGLLRARVGGFNLGSGSSSSSDGSGTSLLEQDMDVFNSSGAQSRKRPPSAESPLIQAEERRGSYVVLDEKNSIETDDEENGDSGIPRPPPGFFNKLKWNLTRCCFRPPQYYDRTIELEQGGASVSTRVALPQNVIRNQKYSILFFLPVVLFEQFKFFFNLYFLIVALSQFVPALQVGYLFTYVAPLVFVLSITIAKEALDDYKRFKRDKEANSQIYQKLTPLGLVPIPSSEIQVGDYIQVEINQRVPADMIVLRTTEKSGASFIRTDQLDGETDWKLRRAVSSSQKLPSDDALVALRASVYVEKPKKDIYNFVGNFTRIQGDGMRDSRNIVEPLSVENTIWMNTVVASGTVIGLVIYTGKETRSVMNTSQPSTKTGKLDLELNTMAKLLCLLLVLLAFLMVSLNQFSGNWPITLFRFTLLFSAIIPISLRVNLDMGKTLYSYLIMKDKEIEGTIVRTSTIPEELGRISYLLTDKTGTLTQNEMIFKKLHLGTVNFGKDTVEELSTHLHDAFVKAKQQQPPSAAVSSSNAPAAGAASGGVFTESRMKKNLAGKVKTAISCIALCHNVTPSTEADGSITYQASSPDEVALVKFTESIGLTLYSRSLTTMTLRTPLGDFEEYEVLNVFPFTSETKRMGIILKEPKTGVITFYMKGADAVMAKIVQASDWLEEECGNMAREGLRTLVFGMREMTQEQYDAFAERYAQAKTTIQNRAANVQAAIESIEADLQLVGVTGVEDKLQHDVKPTLEMLRNAGIRVWMLTGDKIETATCIAISARLVSRNQTIFQIQVKTVTEAYTQLTIFANKKDACLVIDGHSLQLCLDNYKDMFVNVACKAPAVVCCRCSPTQKAEIVKLIREYTKERTCAIGDGGNDVSMIQAADVGLGIVGKEGKQASLAADFSINQFSYISRLLLWHGRNSYKRSARLSQFIIHRGLIISFIQAVFSALFYFAAIAIYNGWLLVGYATVYTMAPVFSLVLDEDVSEDIAFQFPELYQELQKGRVLSIKTFFQWSFISVYQGGIIMLLAIFLFDASLYNIVSITFTVLVFTELFNIAFEIQTWHWVMVASEVATALLYIVSLFILRSYFDVSFILTWDFVWKVSLITAVTTVPIYVVRFIKRKCDPPAYTKLR
eukprot:TRINITY_DN5485_c0_g1_i1.p1 TRINITY_DN5485_c0_g1~~TRINITY_DN5485_c0_g1_i1.p1  ORF type:complete len:1142 (+),score=257.53 TRINITY_DN5485_c0_g1_i1:61-3486(+)